MKPLMHIFFAACVCSVLSFGITMLRAQDKISGSYNIYTKDAIVQTDKYEVIPGKSYIDEIKGTAKEDTTQRYETKLENNQFLTMTQTASDLIVTSIKFNNNVYSFYEKTAMVGALPDENRSPVFEAASYSHFNYLLGLYDPTKGAKQVFSVIIPSLQDFINVEIEKHGTDAFKIGEQTVTANHYRFAIGKKRETVNLWVDNNKVIAVYLASSNKYIIDAGYPQLYERVKQVINRPM